MWLEQMNTPDEVMATDACLTGIGGISGKQYFHKELPEGILNMDGVHIAHFEMLGVWIALQLWAWEWRGTRFRIYCNNESVVTILNMGKAWDQMLQKLLREIAYVLAVNNVEIHAVHLSSEENRVSDLLSRYHTHQKYKDEFNRLKKPDWCNVQITNNMLNFINPW